MIFASSYPLFASISPLYQEILLLGIIAFYDVYDVRCLNNLNIDHSLSIRDNDIFCLLLGFSVDIHYKKNYAKLFFPLIIDSLNISLRQSIGQFQMIRSHNLVILILFQDHKSQTFWLQSLQNHYDENYCSIHSQLKSCPFFFRYNLKQTAPLDGSLISIHFHYINCN